MVLGDSVDPGLSELKGDNARDDFVTVSSERCRWGILYSSGSPSESVGLKVSAEKLTLRP